MSQREQHAATRYSRRWHRVAAWAASALPGDVEALPGRTARIARIHGQWVIDLADDEEAASQADDMASLLLNVTAAPNREVGGYRRVILRAYSWVWDEDASVCHDAQWITTGEAMSAHAAVAAHNRYIRAYRDAVAHGVESRRLVVTAQEILWWTAGPTTDYV